MVRRRAGPPDQPAGYPPYLADDTLTTAHPLNPPKLQFRHHRTQTMTLAYYNALAAGDTTTDVAV